MKVEHYYKIEISHNDSFYREALDYFLILKLEHCGALSPEDIRFWREGEKIIGEDFEIKIFYDDRDVRNSLRRLSSKRKMSFFKESRAWTLFYPHRCSSTAIAREYFADIYTKCSNNLLGFSGKQDISYADDSICL